MEQRLFEYFYASCEDDQTRKIASRIIEHAKSTLKELDTILIMKIYQPPMHLLNKM